MSETESFLSGKHILAVDDEADVLETIEELLEESIVDTARDYKGASKKIKERRYDLAILDIMGVDGLQLLEEAVDRGIPAVMLTAHAMTPESLKESIKLGAVSFLPKEMMAELDTYLADVITGSKKMVWRNLLDNLSDYFDRQFGANWKEKDEFFKKFEEELQSSKEDPG